MILAQDHIPISSKTGKPGLGNLIALPLQGKALLSGNSAFIDENWNAYPYQWECLKNAKRLSAIIVEEKIREWCSEGVLGQLNTQGGIEQFTGCLHRDYDTKTEVIIYDYVDSHIRVLEKMCHKRLRTYKKIGYEI